ncbi:MAG TPA: hypothetical protein VMW40_02070 [Candidatus Bathyarchaeia archaeon]|nr:hypothetical protein [Candidatus Bathyarchaeia archaeon]
MVEDLGSIIEKGFETWKNNLIICLPFVFTSILTAIVAGIIIFTTIIATMPSLIPSLENLAAPPQDLIPQLPPQLLQSIGIIIVAVIVAVLIAMLINAFFWAGAIGMAKEATETGHTDLSHMLEYGKRKFVSLFFTDIIVGLISFAGIVFLIPGILYLLPKVRTFSELPEGEIIAAFVLFGLGLLVMIVYIVIISILLALPRYAVVIGDMGAIEGIKTGFRCFMSNKLAVFLLWLIVLVVSIIAGSFGVIPYIGGLISALLSVIVIEPLTVIWWSRLYLSMEESPEETTEL